MRKLAVVLALALVVILGGGLGWRWWTTWRFQESTDDAYIESDTSVISPRIEGYIKEVRVAANQHVKKGAVLVVIDDRDLRLKLAQAEAALASEQASVLTYDRRMDLQRSVIAQSRAELAAAEADQTRAAQDYQRYQQLAATDFASRQRLEAAEADSRKAQAAVTQKEAALTAARDQLNVLRAMRDEEKAKRTQARTAVALAQKNVDDTVIRAPFAGVVGNRAGRVGQYVKPGTMLLSLVPLPAVYVTANFKETQLTAMRPGQRAEISVDAYPDHPIEGRVESFAPASGAQFSLLPPDNATGNFTKIVQRVPVRIAVPPAGPLAHLLRPGLSVTVTVDTRTGPAAHTTAAHTTAAHTTAAATPPGARGAAARADPVATP